MSMLGDIASLLTEEERELEPQSYDEAVKSAAWRESMEEERRSLQRRGCWRIVDTPEGVSVIKSKYVFRIKRDVAGKIKKRKSDHFR